MALHLAEGGRGENIPSKAFSEAWGAPAGGGRRRRNDVTIPSEDVSAYFGDAKL